MKIDLVIIKMIDNDRQGIVGIELDDWIAEWIASTRYALTESSTRIYGSVSLYV